MTRTPSDLVSPGAVVRMRGRLWRIDQTRNDGAFAATPLDGRETGSRWFARQLEKLDKAHMQFPAPASVGPVATQKLLLDAYRVSAIHGTAPIQGLQRSRAVPTEFQLVPLLSVLGKDRARLLIADDVGTGKTVEAGLVLAELAARGLVHRVLVAVPANLLEQWAEALEHFFHLSPTIVAGHLLPPLERRLLPGQSVWGSYDVVVASIDYLKRRPETVFSHRWDLVIIDEGHLAARPHQSRPSESQMQRWQFALKAATSVPHLLVLTATPHNGYHDSYASLLELIEPDLVRRTDDGHVIIDRDRAKRFVVQRRRDDIQRWYSDHGRPSPFPQEDQDEVIIDPSDELRQMLRAVASYSGHLYEGATSHHVNGWIAAHLQKRALSSPEALRHTLRNRMAALKSRATVEPTGKLVREARDHVADSFAHDDASDEERSSHVDVAQSTLTSDTEIDLLAAALDAAQQVTPARDSKLRRLFEVLGGPRRAPGSGRLDRHPDRRRVIVFTRFKDTLDYLVRELQREASKKTRSVLPADLKVFAIYGEMTQRQRRETFAEFERAQPAVLVATDCISEGLNLQAHCAELIHYELVYNPSRLAQRNGRISRYGQPEPTVGIRLLVLDDPLDQGLLEMVVNKTKRIYAQYGYVPNFLANPDILYHLSHAANRASLVRSPTLFDAETLDSSDAELLTSDPFSPEQLESIVEESFYGQEGVTLGRVQEALDATRAAVGGPDRLAAFVDLGLGYYGVGRSSDDGERTWRVDGSHPDLDEVLADPTRRYTFDAAVGMSDPDVDIVDLSHPLVGRLVDLTVERSNLPECEGRIAAMHTPDVSRVTAVCHVRARFVAHGDPPVLLEELVPVAMPVYGNDPVPVGDTLTNPADGTGRRSTAEVVSDADVLLARADLTDRVDTVLAGRRDEIAATHRELDSPWSQGLDDVEVASWDLVAITLLYPEVT